MKLKCILLIFTSSLSAFSNDYTLINKDEYRVIGIKDYKGIERALSKREIKSKLDKSPNDSIKLDKLLNSKNSKKCIDAIKSKFISVSQVSLCKNLEKHLNPSVYETNLLGNTCGNLENEEGLVLKSNLKISEKGNDNSDAIALYEKYHCNCNADKFSCLNKVHFCGNLYDTKLIQKSYKELEELALYDEMIGKSLNSPLTLNPKIEDKYLPNWDKKKYCSC